MLKKYSAVIFDLDGTILDTDQMLFSIIKKLFTTYRPDYHPSETDLFSFSGPPLLDSFQKFFPKVDSLLILNAYRQQAQEIMVKEISFYPGTLEFLNKLKKSGFLLGIVTNKQTHTAHQNLKILKADIFFDCVIGYDDVKNPKPFPDGLLKCVKTLDLIISNCLFVGDSIYDYKAAEGAKMDFALVKWSGRKAMEGMNPTYQVESYANLWEVIHYAGNL